MATDDEGEQQHTDEEPGEAAEAEPEADELEPIDPNNYDVVATARRSGVRPAPF